MWIGRKKYKELISENQCLQEYLDSRRSFCNALVEDNKILIDKNKSMAEELEQLKVKYADEVKKNFELSSYLSENKRD